MLRRRRDPPLSYSERLSAVDASFLEIEDQGTHMHVAVVLIFDAAPLTLENGGLDIERVRTFIASRLHRIPRYRERLTRIPVDGQPAWVEDENFNLHYHVRHTSLPQPGDVRLLKRLAGRIMSQQLDRGKPLWEMWIVEGLEGGRFAVITKVHHCMVDGIAGVDVLMLLMRRSPDASIEEPPAWFPRPRPSPGVLLAEEAVRRVRRPLNLARRATKALREPSSAVASVWESVSAVGEALDAGMRSAPNTPLNPPHIGPHRRFDWIRFDLDAVKEVRSRLGGTINDVVLATVAGAVGRFLRGRGVGTARLDFRAMVPVSTRVAAERGRFGNRVAMLLARLPINEPDPRERLRRVSETTAGLKHSKQVLGAELIEEIGDWLGTAIVTGSVRLAARIRAYNMVVTNVPGPRVPLYLLGAPLLETYPMVPLFSNQALGIALFSYHGGLYWGFNADWDRVPDLHELVEMLVLEFDELRKAAAAESSEQATAAARGVVSVG